MPGVFADPGRVTAPLWPVIGRFGICGAWAAGRFAGVAVVEPVPGWFGRTSGVAGLVVVWPGFWPGVVTGSRAGSRGRVGGVVCASAGRLAVVSSPARATARVLVMTVSSILRCPPLLNRPTAVWSQLDDKESRVRPPLVWPPGHAHFIAQEPAARFRGPAPTSA